MFSQNTTPPTCPNLTIYTLTATKPPKGRELEVCLLLRRTTEYILLLATPTKQKNFIFQNLGGGKISTAAIANQSTARACQYIPASHASCLDRDTTKDCVRSPMHGLCASYRLPHFCFNEIRLLHSVFPCTMSLYTIFIFCSCSHFCGGH